jgi:hypothetical protein
MAAAAEPVRNKAKVQSKKEKVTAPRSSLFTFAFLLFPSISHWPAN